MKMYENIAKPKSNWVKKLQSGSLLFALTIPNLFFTCS